MSVNDEEDLEPMRWKGRAISKVDAGSCLGVGAAGDFRGNMMGTSSHPVLRRRLSAASKVDVRIMDFAVGEPHSACE